MQKSASVFYALAFSLAAATGWPAAVAQAEDAASPAPPALSAPAKPSATEAAAAEAPATEAVAAPTTTTPPAPESPAQTAPVAEPPKPSALAEAVAAATASAKLNAPPKTSEPSPVARRAYETLVAALQSGKYQSLIEQGDKEFKATVKDTPFDAITEVYGGRLRGGFTASYFGDMKKSGGRFYFWKLVFKDGSDDIIVQIGVKNDKLNNFFLL